VAPESGPLTRTLNGIARRGGDDRHLATQICHAYVHCLDVSGAAISVLTATTSRQTLAATDPTATTLEDLQFTLGEGVCIDAATSGRPVTVLDIHDHLLTTRWPIFAAAVSEHTPARALLALPLQLGTINLGVLDLYRTTPGPLRGHDLRDALAAADAATLMLLTAPAHTCDTATLSSGDGSGWDETGWDELGWDGSGIDRAEIHQATGMILAQLDVPAQDAFLRLRAHAFATGRPLAHVARDVVARRLVFTPDMD